MLIRKICLLGGTGFVGRTLANQLTREGIELRILTRNREYHKENLILLPTVELVEADIHDPEELRRQFRDCDAVINLVGILNERGRSGKGFHKVHVELTEKILAACRDNHIHRLLHMSALNADADNGKSHYLKSKGIAENLVMDQDPAVIRTTAFRPSVIFGRHDSFFNRFAGLLKIFPVFPLACPRSRFAPVYVEDVAEVFTRTLNDPDAFGKRLDLCGPKTYTLQELVQYTAACLDIRRLIIPLNDTLSRMQAMVFDFVPGKPFSTDNYLSALTNSICQQHNHLTDYISTPASVEAIVPRYLSNRNERARYYRFRRQSGRQSEN